MDIYTTSSPSSSSQQEKKRKRDGVFGPMHLTIFLTCVWATTILYGEMLSYWVPLSTCSWPHLSPSSSSSSSDDHHFKIAVIADPQIMDSTTHGFPRKSFILELLQFYTDLYMRRAFHSSILPFKPDEILFLGDQFDGGPYLSDEEWQESMSRFKHIFGLNEQTRNSYIPIHYLSGNHDIGYSAYYTQHPEVITRYEKEFGKRNYNFTVGKVEFIVIDAQTLDGPKEGRETSSSWDFIQNFSEANQNPRVLLTHIPLYRPDNTPCGQHRSSPIINQRVYRSGFDQGITYQNYLSKESSELLLSKIKPVLVLSGHDHDQCTFIHSTSSGPVTEHTLGTVSWQQGNLYPSFMLLSVLSGNASSVSNDDLNHSVSSQLCHLPFQTHIYIWYLCQALVTIVVLTTWPTNGFSSSGYVGKFFEFIKNAWHNFTATVKEKNDEEDCEYEMVWDAEGTMHLIKKAASKVNSSNVDTRTGARGNAVSRPTARKHQQEVTVEMGNQTLLEDPKLPSGKSKVIRCIQRLVRVVKLVVVIAAVNVPLYMMLLFKDWIER
ncbi:Calcineurin-like metallo-phosphoesterase superfamily protein [Rhynchospora pubera]|uniref:Calcineurin-like metallo-phosphoesterase superfamily protein n=1 Tax=Rhynchospora pubera TaxID=906938 RepID=A0AAV8FIG9_9POAL|nr:Calcineurin-like metallo-phosphoesterase superfamily protein [Rhynchospora pubera]